MFSDTHFHFSHLVKDLNLNGTKLIQDLLNQKTFFALDIGTKSNDLSSRTTLFNNSTKDFNEQEKTAAKKMFYFSAGIWPSVEEIKNRTDSIQTLKNEIQNSQKNCENIIAIGECGLDHHWNPSGADKHNLSDFDKNIFEGEKELFSMQIELSKQMKLPLIVHTREAFSETLDCLKNSNCTNGIIHCFSYGIDEARAFLDQGFYIALGGSTTYAKKTKIEEMKKLIQFIPDDRLLLETDSPYLAPVPYRGKTNTPLLIKYTYDFIAQAKEIKTETLCELVDNNIKNLFLLKN